MPVGVRYAAVSVTRRIPEQSMDFVRENSEALAEVRLVLGVMVRMRWAAPIVLSFATSAERTSIKRFSTSGERPDLTR